MGFRTPDSNDQNHRNAVCRGYLEVSSTKRLLASNLLLASSTSGLTYVSAITIEESPSSLGSLFQCCTTCLPKLGCFCHLCVS